MNRKIQVGDILVSVFGYDARIPCFWKVLKRTEKMATIARMIDVHRNGNWVDGTVAPNEDSRLSEPVAVKVRDCDGECVNTRYGIGRHWDGKPELSYNHH
jgi:hypothetical protein